MRGCSSPPSLEDAADAKDRRAVAAAADLLTNDLIPCLCLWRSSVLQAVDLIMMNLYLDSWLEGADGYFFTEIYSDRYVTAASQPPTKATQAIFNTQGFPVFPHPNHNCLIKQQCILIDLFIKLNNNHEVQLHRCRYGSCHR